MLPPSATGPNYDYSKMTATNASRSIIAQFVSFRSSVTLSSYCRGVEFIAFIASTTLCLAHIEARRQSKACGTGKNITTFQSLRHQRLSDRGLLEHTLEIMETMAQEGKDAIAQKISGILRPLLAIDSESAKGRSYMTTAFLGTRRQSQESPNIGETGERSTLLHIQIPCFGTIKIEHSPVQATLHRGTEMEHPIPLGTRLRDATESQAPENDLAISSEPASPRNGEDHRNQQRGVNSTVRHPENETSVTQLVDTDWQAIPSGFNSQGPVAQAVLTDWDISAWPLDTPDGGSSQGLDSRLVVPSAESRTDEWALEGVDIALFTSLLGGSTA